MNSLNDRDGARDPSAQPTAGGSVGERSHRDQQDHGAFYSVWHWSRHQVHHAAGLVRKFFLRRPPSLRFSAGSRCVKGPIRDANEDRCYADQHRGLFIVADGMGGHAGGEQASQSVIEVIASRLGGLLEDSGAWHPHYDRAMLAAVRAANEELMNMAQLNVSLSGMGAAVVVGVVRHSQLRICSVGDCRAYVLRHGQLQQLTLDDTLVQGLVSAGALTVGEAARHPMRHVLLHSVGTRKLEKDMQVETYPLRPGDRLLFASDGLTDAISPDGLAKLLALPYDSRSVASALADHAQQAGARDNITCIVVDVSC